VDVIKIVPLHDEAAAAEPVSAPAANMTYRGGPLLANVDVVTVFLGSVWHDGALDSLAHELDAFFDFVVSSTLLDQLSEYSVAGYAIGHGTHSSSVRLDQAQLGTTVTDDTLRTIVRDAIAARSLPDPTPNTLYALFLPPGVTVELQGSRSCRAFCGYHDAIDGSVFYAILASPDCTGCGGGRPPLEALTITSSHELAEAITDAVPGSGWYDDTYGEIGDVCAWQTKKLGDYVIQLEWSNAARGCV
jgi:hypothetical protein